MGVCVCVGGCAYAIYRVLACICMYIYVCVYIYFSVSASHVFLYKSYQN